MKCSRRCREGLLLRSRTSEDVLRNRSFELLLDLGCTELVLGEDLVDLLRPSRSCEEASDDWSVRVDDVADLDEADCLEEARRNPPSLDFVCAFGDDLDVLRIFTIFYASVERQQ